MFRWLLFLALMVAPAAAQAQRQNAIQPQLIAEGPVAPGGEVELAIHMRTRPGWHGYWLNPGDAGLPMSVEWRLPAGYSVGELRYPVPTRLTIAGLMNYVFEEDYAILVRLRAPPGASGTVPIGASARWLACTDKICVPESGAFAGQVVIGAGAPNHRPQFDAWRRKLPQPLSTPARFAIEDNLIRVAVPLPRDAPVGRPYLYPATDGLVDYAGVQRFRRAGDLVVAELPRKPGPDGPTASFAGVLEMGEGRALSFEALPGRVPDGGTPIGEVGRTAVLWAVLGAILGGILLNLMPCVFPILALKALHLAKSGGSEARIVRRDALGYAAGAIIGTGALGLALLALRAGGASAGWAFQLQDPRSTLLLMLLAVAITLNLVGLFRLPAIGGEARPTGSFATGTLAAFVATPCAGPFLGAALGTALLLPPAGSLLVFAALGLGLAVPMLAVAFIPAVRNRLPRPGPWMIRLQRFLAIPMAATAVGALWLLSRQGGSPALTTGLAAAAALALVLLVAGRVQRSGRAVAALALPAAVTVAVVSVAIVPERSPSSGPAVAGAEAWSEARVAELRREGRPVFVYFTADWCLSCKANEAVAIGRSEVRDAFGSARVAVLAGDWTNGDPAITRFLESRGRAGVPLYLWYAPGSAEAEELPQILTPAMLTDRARRAR